MKELDSSVAMDLIDSEDPKHMIFCHEIDRTNWLWIKRIGYRLNILAIERTGWLSKEPVGY